MAPMVRDELCNDSTGSNGVDARRIDVQARLLAAILLLGFALRIAYALDQPTLSQYTGEEGGDSSRYLVNGAGFFSGKEHGYIREIPFYISRLKPAPLYILFVGVFQVWLPDHEAIIAIRLVQCLASIATAYLAYRLATIIAGRASAGIIAAALLALHPAFIIDPARISTETLYIFFLALGLWLYTEYSAGLARQWRLKRLGPFTVLALAAAAFGLATLTRGVAALVPFALAFHLIWLGRLKHLPSWRRHCLLLLLVYGAFVSTWTIYNVLNWNRFVIVSDQLMGALWRGAESRDGTPQQNDKLLLEASELETAANCVIDCGSDHAADTYVRKISAIVSGDPGGYLALRISELAYAMLQPYGTTTFGDVSVINAGRRWLLGDRSLAGIAAVIQLDGFAIKLLFWLFHYIGIGFGILGIMWSRKRWITAAPLAGFALYTVAIHVFLLALPRYLFPIELTWLVFAGIALAAILERRQQH